MNVNLGIPGEPREITKDNFLKAFSDIIAVLEENAVALPTVCIISEDAARKEFGMTDEHVNLIRSDYSQWHEEHPGLLMVVVEKERAS